MIRGRLAASLFTSLLVISAGVIGFQFGDPSSRELESGIESLNQDIQALDNQVQGLTEFIVRNDREQGITSDADYLWAFVWVPQSEYSQPLATSQMLDQCAGSSGWEMDNFGVARPSETLPEPTYGIYMGVIPQTAEGVAYCVQQYFFPSFVKTTPLIFGEWDTSSFPTGPMGVYWEVRSAEVDWEEHAISLIVDP